MYAENKDWNFKPTSAKFSDMSFFLIDFGKNIVPYYLEKRKSRSADHFPSFPP